MNGLQSQGLFLDGMLAFGLASLLKYEAMHNLDLGLAQDLLQLIEHFFAVHEGRPPLLLSQSLRMFGSQHYLDVQ